MSSRHGKYRGRPWHSPSSHGRLAAGSEEIGARIGQGLLLSRPVGEQNGTVPERAFRGARVAPRSEPVAGEARHLGRFKIGRDNPAHSNPGPKSRSPRCGPKNQRREDVRSLACCATGNATGWCKSIFVSEVR
jgi:hypothetical protein